MKTAVEQPGTPRTDAHRRDTLLVCFMHDHLQEVTRLQCRVIEATLLGEEFVSEDTAEQLRLSAALYLSYAEQIEMKAKEPQPMAPATS